jgi:multidrug efflux system outer membrane protein
VAVPFAWAEPFALTLDEAVRRALGESLSLQKSAIDLGVAEYRAEHLWAEVFPSFSLRAGLTLLPSTPLFTDPGFQYNRDASSYSLDFGVTLQFNAGIPYSMKMISLAWQKGLLDYEDARRQLEIRITKTFFQLLTARENISYLESSLTLARQQLEQDRIARENGLLSELAWLESRLGTETARYNLSSAQGEYSIAQGEFLVLLGMDQNTEVVLEGSVDIAPVTVDPEALILEYLPKRPDIISRRQTIENLELRKKMNAGSAKAPSLSLSSSWNGGSSFSGDFADRLSGSLTLTIPVDSWIPGTKTNQTGRADSAEVEKARLDLRDAETAAKTQIRSLAANLRNSWASLEIALLRVEIARRTYEYTEEGFRNGTVDYQNFEDTRNELTSARQRLLQSELAYQNLILDLAAALNVDWKELTRSLL